MWLRWWCLMKEILKMILTQIEYELRPHQRCAAHTLNLVANNDVNKFLSSSPLSRSIYWSSFGKCTALWNKASHSTVASDKLQEVLKRKLLVPSTTHWNVYYDAIERVVENPLQIWMIYVLSLTCVALMREKSYSWKNTVLCWSHCYEDWIHSKVKITVSMVLCCQRSKQLLRKSMPRSLSFHQL